MSSSLTCVTCQEKITSGDYLQLGKNTYHTKHFWCFTCKKLLENEDFSEYDEKVFCETHYLEAMNAPKCMKCLEYLLGEYCIVQGKTFHANCFKCDYCKRPFPNSEYYKSEKYFLCQSCFGKFKAETCAACGKSIVDQICNAMGKTFHFDCLVCLKCGDTFDDDGYITIDDHPFHEDCIAVYCAECEENIKDEYFEVDGESVHERCLEKFQKRDKTKKNLSKNELAEKERKEKLERNLKEKEIKEHQKKEAILKMEETLKKKELETSKKKGEEALKKKEEEIFKKKESPQKSEKTEKESVPIKKGPPNFAAFMKTQKGKGPNIVIEKTMEKTTVITTEKGPMETEKKQVETEKKTIIETEKKKEKMSVKPPEKNPEIREKPQICEEKTFDKPKISTISVSEQNQEPEKPKTEVEKVLLSQKVEEKKGKKDKKEEKEDKEGKTEKEEKEMKSFDYENKTENETSFQFEKQIKIEKTEFMNVTISVPVKSEEKTTKIEETVEEEKKEETQTVVKIEKKFIKMHNKFKKI